MGMPHVTMTQHDSTQSKSLPFDILNRAGETELASYTTPEFAVRASMERLSSTEIAQLRMIARLGTDGDFRHRCREIAAGSLRASFEAGGDEQLSDKAIAAKVVELAGPEVLTNAG
jgi:hypothetical protein